MTEAEYLECRLNYAEQALIHMITIVTQCLPPAAVACINEIGQQWNKARDQLETERKAP